MSQYKLQYEKEHQHRTMSQYKLSKNTNTELWVNINYGGTPTQNYESI